MSLQIRTLIATSLLSAMSCVYAGEAPSMGNTTVTSLTPLEMTDWGTPKALLPGANDYVLQGNPGKAGIYTVRLKLPANYRIPPYNQTSTTYMTVIAGDFHMGVGDKFDASTGKDLPPGSFITIPPNVDVYAWTTNGTILQIHGEGPWGVKYVTSSAITPIVNKQ